MKHIKKIGWVAVAGILLVSFIYLGQGVTDYISFRNTAKSVGGMPWQDGGKITKVVPCVLDTPAVLPITCAASCPLITPLLIPPSACVAYNEIQTTSQHGTISIAALKLFVYKGGGTFPVAGMSYLAGGASNAIPWVIGIPAGMGMGMKIQKAIDWFNYGIASFRDK